MPRLSLQKKRRRQFLLGLFVALIALSFVIPYSEEICSKDEYTYAKQCTPQHPVLVAFWKIGKAFDDWNAIITALSTVAIAAFTIILARINRSHLDHLHTSDRAYLTGGGDIEDREGRQFFRFDVENHGKTPAFMVAYDVRFAKLEELRREYPKVREVCKQFAHLDGLSPTGARKKIYTDIPREQDNDAVYGAVWYKDIWGDEHFSRFILRIAESPDIKGEGLTRLDVKGVSREYWSWDYPKKKQAQEPSEPGPEAL